MNVLLTSLVLMCAQELGKADASQPAPKAVNPLRALHWADAQEYRIYRDEAKKEMLELRKEPIYLWTNPTRVGGQTGDVYVWTWHGRPEAVGSIFSHPAAGNRRQLCHEFHSLSPMVLIPEGNERSKWRPKAGAELKPVPGAPRPAGSASQRTLQMKTLARDFTAHEVSSAVQVAQGQRWELRLQTTPLYQYESTSPEGEGGGLFTFVTTAGTDPEIILLLEARKTADGPQWMFTPARFSDFNLYLRYKDQEVWSSVRGGEDTRWSDAKHLYHFHQDKQIPEVVPPR